MDADPTMRALVASILKSPHGLEWSVQGLGMMRTYLDPQKTLRLHIWDSRYRVEGVSPIHDHPWDMKSTIIAGVYRQVRYNVIEQEWLDAYRDKFPPIFLANVSDYKMATIKCGEDACVTVAPVRVKLQTQELEGYGAGQSYSQRHEEIHQSLAVDGTVTLVERVMTTDPDHARVFWSGDGEFVDAAPRPAYMQEIIDTTHAALDMWFGELA